MAEYPRWTDLAFLNFCDPRIRGFYEYWNLKRGSRTMPSRADIDPSDIVAYLPAIVLVDVLSADQLTLRYRLAGTLETEARGYDPTGRLVSDHFQGTSSGDVLENYRLVISKRTPVFDTACVPAKSERLVEKGTILLPLSDDGENVNMVIVYTAIDRLGYTARITGDPGEVRDERPARNLNRSWSTHRPKTRLRRRNVRSAIRTLASGRNGARRAMAKRR